MYDPVFVFILFFIEPSFRYNSCFWWTKLFNSPVTDQLCLEYSTE